MQWEAFIGLEIHTQLATHSKIFSGSSTDFGAKPNTQASLVDLGLPGTLPVFNAEALTMAVKFGLSVGATVNKRSIFDRKNYFYPDLPKGYQITQLHHPIVEGGSVTIDLESGDSRTIRITRAHLEEDAGKSLHEDFQGCSGIDLNRAGTPLLEIVSEPEIRSPQEAAAYFRKIHAITTYLGICDGNLSQGSMRCDCNISIRPKGSTELGTRTELKNINSFRFVEKAIETEIERQIDLVESGGQVVQETRLYDADKNQTRPMRSKEVANDYRYFPDPDLLPVEIDEDFIKDIKQNLPEMPDQKKARFIQEHQLSDYDARILTQSKALSDYYEQVAAVCHDHKLSANWIMGELSAALNKSDTDIHKCPISANQLGALILRIKDNSISGKIAKQVFVALWDGKATDVDTYIESSGLKQMTDSSAIEKVVDEVIESFPEQVSQYQAAAKDKQGKMLGFFVGQVMKASEGKANPKQVNTLLKAKLS